MGGITHATTLSSGRSALLRPRSLLRAQRDERLVSQLRAGNQRAFEALFDRYRGRLLAFCRGMLRSSEDAEDVLQEVFVAAHEAILADERTIEVRPWLYRIARNRCLNHLRRPQPEGQDSLDEHPGGNGITTEEHAARRQDLRDLVESIRELPETQRSALLLRELEALPHDQIAASLGTTVPAVKSLLVRARISLAEASQARELSCADVRFALATAAEGNRRAPGPVRHHVRRCPECTAFRAHLRSTSKGLAALAPVGPILLLKRLIGAKLGGAGGGSGGAGTGMAGGAGGTGGAGIGAGAAGASAGSGTLAAGGIGLVGSKAATGMAVAALLGAGGAATLAAPQIPSPAAIVSAIESGRESAGAGGGLMLAAEGGGRQGPGDAPAGVAEDVGDTDAATDDELGEGLAEEGGQAAGGVEEAPATEDETDDGSSGDDAEAARRARLLALFQRDREAARRWWQRFRQRHPESGSGGDGGPAPRPPYERPPTEPPPSEPPPPGPPRRQPPPRSERPPAPELPPPDDGTAASEPPGDA